MAQGGGPYLHFAFTSTHVLTVTVEVFAAVTVAGAYISNFMPAFVKQERPFS